MPGTPDGRPRTRWNDKEADPAQFREELSNNLSCLTICRLHKGWSSRSRVWSEPRQARPQPEPQQGQRLPRGQGEPDHLVFLPQPL